MMKKTISEYGGKETYKSMAAKAKHESKESPMMERKERKMSKGGMAVKGCGMARPGKFKLY